MSVLTKIGITAIMIAAATVSAGAQQKSSVLDITSHITDSNIVFPESFEVDTQKMLDGWYMKNYMVTDDRYQTQGDVSTNDATYQKRLSALHTAIDLPYNQIVREYIERYTTRGRSQVTALLGLANYYMPIFEQALEENGLPLELKYLPVIESALNPNAVSKHGAAGLWQFTLATAKGMGMEVSSLVDERRDPYVSSQMAAKYLKDLYEAYGNWSLAIAAYNCGPGTINKAIRRAGGDPARHDFWSIYEQLTPETRGYVPSFIAANYVMNYYPEHNISPVVPAKPLVTDTLNISNRVHFEQIAAVLDIPIEELRILNPQFRADIIPGDAEHTYTLVLPSRQVQAYIMSEQAIKDYEAEKYARRETAEPGEMLAVENPQAVAAESEQSALEELYATPQRTRKAGTTTTVNHKVMAGETLAGIAEKYSVTPEQIKTWNNLKRNSVRTGQILKVQVAEELADNSPRQENWEQESAPAKQTAQQQDKQTAKKTEPKKPATPKTTTYTVVSGDNLSKIAKRQGVTVDQLRKANNITGDNLRPGQKLTIPAKAGSSAAKSKSSSKKKRR